MKSQYRLLFFIIIIADVLIVLAALGLRMIRSHQVPPKTLQNTASPEAVPGLVVYGMVRDSNGAGINHVPIYRSYAAYPGIQIAVTDASGYYQSDFFSIPGDEMVSVWPEQAGFVYSPDLCSWRHYAGYEMKACDFLASATEWIYLPMLAKAPK